MSNPTLYGPDGHSRIATPDPKTADTFRVSPLFDLRTGLGAVRLLLPHTTEGMAAPVDVVLQPHEARMLGLRLIAESEGSVMKAAMMQMCITSGGMSPHEAVQIIDEIVPAVKAAHVMQWEKSLKRTDANKAMEGPAHGEEPS